ncbi:hypothetical protein [Demequina mangrovi]|uniref:Uncharacterized protein n=1 Tax=Demequina mangrovi TaxID=1043493 RepID=A0A1H6UYJ3_9MICO|nr:hypothetical protein [Demequina mangrovi]SEI95734.1 hypothetical protein SAMN05421637_0542 [Demequina mangrovi]
MRRAAAAVGALGLAAALAGCGTSVPDTALPDLSGLGLATVACDDTVQLAGIEEQAGEGAAVECWSGARDGSYVETADAVLALLLSENESGEDISTALCWEDTLSDTEASACRAILVGDTEDGAIVSAVVALEDPATVVGAISDDPSEDEVSEALGGAALEVLVFSEPASAETG